MGTVGGGCKDDNALAIISCIWMIEQVQRRSKLEFNKDFIIHLAGQLKSEVKQDQTKATGHKLDDLTISDQEQKSIETLSMATALPDPYPMRTTATDGEKRTGKHVLRHVWGCGDNHNRLKRHISC